MTTVLERGQMSRPWDSLSLPRLDFASLSDKQRDQASAQREIKAPDRGFRERISRFLEGPWAPADEDLPERDKIPKVGDAALPFRTKPTSIDDAVARKRLLRSLCAGESRERLTSWSSLYSHEVPIRSLPADLDGFTILHLSDIHFLSRNPRAVAEVNALAERIEKRSTRVDLLLVSGDIITLAPDDFCKDARRALRRLSDTCQLSFSTHGNHDYHGHTPALVSRWLEEAKIHDINNHNVRIKVGGAVLNIYGIDDAYFGKPRPPSRMNPAEINIVLTHNLDAIRGDFPRAVDLVLSGHTHWGEARYIDGTWLMGKWGYCDNVNRHTKHWDVLSDRTLSYVHPGLARYYVPYVGLRHPPGFVVHRLKSSPSELASKR